MNGKDTEKPSRSDWARVDALADDEIDDSDSPASTEDDLAQAILRLPEDPSAVTVELDPEVLAGFESRGESLRRLVNAVLRDYLETRNRRHAG